MAKRTTTRSVQRKPTRARRHGHGKERCVAVLKKLSAYIDDELPGALCDELRKHLGDCPNCEEFVLSLRHTVALCRHRPAPALSQAERARMRNDILRAARLR
ncbi:MAG: zf-HC2 domain-containing protein [Nitrospira sp.]|nr:MAG: zf-HC2 domain-containing protein [Nitrospira sp.]